MFFHEIYKYLGRIVDKTKNQNRKYNFMVELNYNISENKNRFFV